MSFFFENRPTKFSKEALVDVINFLVLNFMAKKTL